MFDSEKIAVSSEATVSTSRWYVVYTKPKEEDRAASNLTAWGIETFNPRIKERRFNQFNGNPTVWSKPLFPRYIFARFDVDKLLHKIYFTRGVQSVVCFGDAPLSVEDEDIALIQSHVGKDGFVRMDDELKSGDPVAIESGPLKGLNGVFNRVIKDSDRVMILLTTINYQAQVSIERSLIQRADPARGTYSSVSSRV